MFTGLVEETGTIARIPRAGSSSLQIRCQTVMEGTRIGDSIAVNGVCLTVAVLMGDGFTADLQPVTQRLSNLDALGPGDAVNLERSVGVGDRFGGHYVQGHIDGTARIDNVTGEGASALVRLALPADLMRYVVERGFITVDGASLTITRVLPDGIEVSLVQHTQQAIILARKRPGDRVNIEVDVVAKYIERLLSAPSNLGTDLSIEFLRSNGFA